MIGSWSYSKECVWNLGKKLCCFVPGKWNVNGVAFREFNIWYNIYIYIYIYIYIWTNILLILYCFTLFHLLINSCLILGKHFLDPILVHSRLIFLQLYCFCMEPLFQLFCHSSYSFFYAILPFKFLILFFPPYLSS